MASRGDMLALTANLGKRRTMRIGDVELRTVDRRVDLDATWKFRDQMLQVCERMGVQIIHLRSDDFRCFARHVSIFVRPPTDDVSLCSIAHEACHVGMGHYLRDVPRHREEFETGVFEVAYLRRCGIEPSKKIVDGGKCYVARIIQMAISRHQRRFDRESWEYADFSLLSSSRQKVINRHRHEITLCDDISTGRGWDEAIEWARGSKTPIDGVLHARPSVRYRQLNFLDELNDQLTATETAYGVG